MGSIPIETAQRGAISPTPTGEAFGEEVAASTILIARELGETNRQVVRAAAAVDQVKETEARLKMDALGFQTDALLRREEERIQSETADADEYVEQYTARRRAILDSVREDLDQRSIRYLQPRLDRVSALSENRMRSVERGRRIDGSRAYLVEMEVTAIDNFSRAANPVEQREIMSSYFDALDAAAVGGVYTKEEIAKTKVSFQAAAQTAYDERLSGDYVESNLVALTNSGLSYSEMIKAVDSLPGSSEDKKTLRTDLRSWIDQEIQHETIRSADMMAKMMAEIEKDPAAYTPSLISRRKDLTGAHKTSLIRYLNNRTKGKTDQEIDDGDLYGSFRNMYNDDPEKFLKIRVWDLVADKKLRIQNAKELEKMQTNLRKEGEQDIIKVEGWNIAREQLKAMEGIDDSMLAKAHDMFDLRYQREARRLRESNQTVTEELQRTIRDSVIDGLQKDEPTILPDFLYRVRGFDATNEDLSEMIENEVSSDIWPQLLRNQVARELKRLHPDWTEAQFNDVPEPQMRQIAKRILERGGGF